MTGLPPRVWLPWLVGATILVAVYAVTGTSTADLVASGAKVNRLIDAGQWPRLLWSVGLHADPAHLLMNVAWLLLLGGALSALSTATRAVSIGLWCGVLGQLASYAWVASASVGASGLVYGLTGALAVTVWRRRRDLAPAMRQRILWSFAALTAALVVTPFTVEGADHAAHMGGLAAGLALGAIPASRRVDLVLAAAFGGFALAAIGAQYLGR